MAKAKKGIVRSMKIKWWMLALIFMGLSVARAETTRYISLENDIYWHVNASCGGQLLLEATDTENSFPCPICVQEDVEEGILAVERGGTIILRLSDDWMASREGVQGIFAMPDSGSYTGDAVQAQLSEYLHGDDYNSFLKEWAENGCASAKVYSPSIYPQNQELFMNERHIGGAWYITMRPMRNVGKSLPIYLRFFVGDFKAEGDILEYCWDCEWDEFNYNLKFSDAYSKKSVFSKDYGDFEITLYAAMGTYVAVIYQPNGDEDLLENVCLSLENQPDIVLNGYMNGDTAVYCCVLNAAEKFLLESGASVQLKYAKWYDESDFQGTDYALVKKGTAGYGVIDHNENFVLGPNYIAGQRSGNTVFLRTTGNDWEVYNLTTMESIGRFQSGDGSYVSIYPENSALFAVHMSGVWYFYENETGRTLAVLPEDEEGSADDGFSWIRGRYACFEVGAPERLVLSRGGDRLYVWLADNQGKRISENYQSIDPLIWNEGRGVFAVMTFDESLGYPNVEDYEYLEGADRSEALNNTWRVGLMDENGRMITDIDYVFIRVLSIHQIELHRADGTVEIVEV